jgi:purine-nucleoside phosphorylase
LEGRWATNDDGLYHLLHCDSQGSLRREEMPNNRVIAMSLLANRIDDAVAAIRRHWSGTATAGVILGTGLGTLAEQIEAEATIAYEDIPHFPRSTTIGHTGQLVLGRCADMSVVAMEGRFHAYEGYSFEQLTFPVRVMKALGAGTLIVSNACGGMNPAYVSGDIMVIDDHINLLPGNPLVGPNDDSLGPRFPDMCRPYDPELIEMALAVGQRKGFAVHRGVYVAVLGPNLETRAEYRFLRTIGADVVGMSTVPEVIVAVHAGMRVLGLSVVTDMCLPDSLEPANIEKILAVAATAEPKLRAIVMEVLGKLDAR